MAMAAAALQCQCFRVVPFSSSRTRRPMVVAAPGRVCFPELKTKLQQGSTTAAAAVVVVRAQNGEGRHAQRPHRRQPADDQQHFVEEREHVMRCYADIIEIDHGCLYMEATARSALVCLAANRALKMASWVMDVAYVNLDAAAAAAPNNEISTSTIYSTVLGYVDAFVDAGDASYSRTVNKKTVTSFLGALRGLASVSHILLESALEALSHTHPRESLSEYAFNRDVEAMQLEYIRRMDEIEDAITKASAVKICKLAMPAINEGVKITGSFVKLMVTRRQRALGKANTQLVA